MMLQRVFGLTIVLLVSAGLAGQEAKPAAPEQAPAAPRSSSAPVRPAAESTSGAVPAQTDSQTGSPAASTVPLPSAANVTGPPSDASRYVISAEDSLQITVWKEPSFTGSVPVRPDGMISMALVGDLQAAGFTPMRLSEDIATRLKKYINDPRVTVTVLAVKPKQVFLLGEVAHIGPIAITPEMTPLQAIAASGGLTPFAKAKSIYILRGEPGHQKKILFNYKKALKSGDEQGVSLVPGDTIVVP